MTGNSTEDYGEACRLAGMDGFLVKPITREHLHQVLAGSDIASATPSRS